MLSGEAVGWAGPRLRWKRGAEREKEMEFRRGGSNAPLRRASLHYTSRNPPETEREGFAGAKSGMRVLPTSSPETPPGPDFPQTRREGAQK